jgi:hypothetical protein
MPTRLRPESLEPEHTPAGQAAAPLPAWPPECVPGLGSQTGGSVLRPAPIAAWSDSSPPTAGSAGTVFSFSWSLDHGEFLRSSCRRGDSPQVLAGFDPWIQPPAGNRSIYPCRKPPGTFIRW